MDLLELKFSDNHIYILIPKIWCILYKDDQKCNPCDNLDCDDKLDRKLEGYDLSGIEYQCIYDENNIILWIEYRYDYKI